MNNSMREELRTRRLAAIESLSVTRRTESDEARRAERLWILASALWFGLAWFLVVLASDGIIPLPWSLALLVYLMTGAWLVSRRSAQTEVRQRKQYAVAWLAERRERTEDPDRHQPSPDDGRGYADPAHPFADDLDLFGPGSLFARIHEHATPLGRDALARTLRGEDPESARDARAEGVRELSEDLGFREAMAVAQWEWNQRGTGTPAQIEEREARARELGERFRDPIAAPPSAAVARIWIAASGIFVATLIGAWLSLIPGWVCLVSYLANALMAARVPDLDTIQQRFTKLAESLASSARLVALIEDRDHAAPSLRELAANLAPREGQPASAHIQTLSRLVASLEQRRNAFRSLSTGVAFLPDLHARRNLLRWQVDHGDHLGQWLDAVSRFEAELALAEFTAREPLPVWASAPEGKAFVEATDLAHPLIPHAQRVGNDLHLERNGVIALLTGSNMSGKSTFLRSLGMASIMADVGLPIPAKRLVIPRFTVVTCMRVHDSVLSGSSRFHAEVGRLALCLEIARKAPESLVLLDEILAGTNSMERHAGTRAVLEDLAGRPATIFVATHDLSLAELQAAIPDRVRLWHFRDQVEDGRMTFDYRMRDGICPSTNALRVMRAAGLPVPADQDQETRT